MSASNFRIHGTVLPNEEPQELWIADGKIAEGPIADATTLATDSYVLPGLIDAHCHIGLGPGGAVDEATILEQARTDLAGGVMLIRDAGSPANTAWVNEDPSLPKLVRAGQHIARPKRYLRNIGAEIEPQQLPAEVRKQAKAGDGWVKLVGDWIDRDQGDLAKLWPKDLAAEAIAAAHEEGARVTAHCFAEESVAELVAAGIDCIEHGTGLSGEVIEQMAANGVALVPTMVNLANFPMYAEQGQAKFPRYAAHMTDLFERHKQTIGSAIEAGVNVYCGTDAGTVVAHGRARDEIELLAEVSNAEYALGAASWHGRKWLKAANLEVGSSADLIVVAKDPRVDLSQLRQPIAMLRSGRVVETN